MTEKALAQRVIAWLEAQHWDVYQEVPHGNEAADIVAVSAGLVWVIECKTSCSLSVMHQASRWEVHLRSIAVPMSKRYDERHLAERICKHFLKVGVLYVDDSDYGGIREMVHAPLMRCYHAPALRLRDKLAPEHKTHAQAGSQSGERWTPYRQTMDHVKKYLLAQGGEGATLKQIMAAVGKCHYANEASAKSCIPTALEKWEMDWREVRGEGRERRFYLTGAQRG